MDTAIYHLPGLNSLPFGHQLPLHVPLTQLEAPKVGSTDWTTPTGAFTARELILIASPLLDSVIFRTSTSTTGTPAQIRAILIENLSLSLSTTGRESTLPAPSTDIDTTRKALYTQAQLIGETLTQYAHDTPTVTKDPGLRIRSQCDGHLWTPAVAALLTGPDGGSDVMMLYNEWLHQLVLLRDALLPFENFEEVLLVLGPGGPRGLRGFEKARKVFIAELVGGQVPQSAIVEAAVAVTDGTMVTAGGYGFQYGYGVVLPASLDVGETKEGCLLRYHAACVDEGRTEVLFQYEYPAYIEATRSEIPEADQILPGNTWPPSPSSTLDTVLDEAAILIQPGGCGRSATLSLQLVFGETRIRVDLGQIARGQRFAYHPHSASGTALEASGLSAPAAIHRPSDVLVQSGLVTSGKGGIHVIPTDKPLVVMALLGKIYPENVILMGQKDQPAMAEAVGKGFGPRFIIWKRFE